MNAVISYVASNALPLVVVVLGMGLLILEMYLPGFGLPGIAGIVLSVLGIVFIRPIAKLLGAEGELLENCVLYFLRHPLGGEGKAGEVQAGASRGGDRSQGGKPAAVLCGQGGRGRDASEPRRHG